MPLESKKGGGKVKFNSSCVLEPGMVPCTIRNVSRLSNISASVGRPAMVTRSATCPGNTPNKGTNEPKILMIDPDNSTGFIDLKPGFYEMGLKRRIKFFKLSSSYCSSSYWSGD